MMSSLANSLFTQQMAPPDGEPPLVRNRQCDTHQVAELHRKRPKIVCCTQATRQHGLPAARETFSMKFLGMREICGVGKHIIFSRKTKYYRSKAWKSWLIPIMSE